MKKALTAYAIALLWAAGSVCAQVPTFGSPRQVQQVEITDPETGVRRAITLTKRPDGDYDVRSVEVATGASLNGLLRGSGPGRFSGDLFDAGRGAFREVVVIEQGDALEIQQQDYATGKRARGRVRCADGRCTYSALP